MDNTAWFSQTFSYSVPFATVGVDEEEDKAVSAVDKPFIAGEESVIACCEKAALSWPKYVNTTDNFCLHALVHLLASSVGFLLRLTTTHTYK